MSDTITGNHRANATRLPASVTVQPREITEAAFRALCAAGADPAEAQEGALAVLRAEADAQTGLSLFLLLLEGDWAQPHHPARAESSSWDGGTVRDLCPPEQPGLRTALQLLDLACDGPADEISVARTTAPIPRSLWNDLLLRRTAELQRRIVVATSPPANGNPDVDAGTNFLTVRNGTATATATLPSEALTTLVSQPADPRATIVISLPGGSQPDPQDISVPSKPLKVREDQWHQMYQLSRKFLVPGA
ncbi:hypothetical protein [Arthrobacter sp. UYEF20]|uniref:hypothetical protein n=1 Tax=Arthrobacter sp. UYEF20 TaxID=1756363 RepID=UPI00339AF8E1